MSYSPALQTPSILVPIKFTDPNGIKETIKVAFKRFATREESFEVRNALVDLIQKHLRMKLPAPKPLEEDDERYKTLDEESLEWIKNYQPSSKEAIQAIEKEIHEAIIDKILWFEDIYLTDNTSGEKLVFKSTQESKVEHSKVPKETWESAGFLTATAFIADIYVKSFWGTDIVDAYLTVLLNHSLQEDAKRKN